jgi:hypothetical protein
MISTFNNSRWLYYKVTIINIFLKSLIISIFTVAMLITERYISKSQGSVSMDLIFGKSMVDINNEDIIKITLFIFLVLIVMGSISLVLSSIEQMGCLLYFLSFLILAVIWHVYRNVNIINLKSYLVTLSISIIIIIFNFFIGWLLIKKKTCLSESWIMKYSVRLRQDSKNK